MYYPISMHFLFSCAESNSLDHAITGEETKGKLMNMLHHTRHLDRDRFDRLIGARAPYRIKRSSVERRLRALTQHPPFSLIQGINYPLANFSVVEITASWSGLSFLCSGRCCCRRRFGFFFIFLHDGCRFDHRCQPSVLKQHWIGGPQIWYFVQTASNEIVGRRGEGFGW